MSIFSHPARRDSGNAGFTLIEVMVAATVAVILLAALLRVFGSVWDLNGRIREEAASIVVAQTVMEAATQRTALAAGAQAGRLGDYGWSVTVTEVTVPPASENPVAQQAAAQKRAPSLLSNSQTSRGDDDEQSDEDAKPAEQWNWRLFRIDVAVLSPLGRRTNLETLRLAPAVAR